MSKVRDFLHITSGTYKDIKHANDEHALRTLAPNESAGFRYPAVYSLSHLLLTKEAAWVGHKIPMKPWGFLSTERKRQYFNSTRTFFEQVFPAEKNNAGQLLVTNLVYSGEDWKKSLIELHEHSALPIYPLYVDGALRAMDRQTFYSKECFLFTRMGNRGEATGMRGWVRNNMSMLLAKAGSDDSQPDYTEKEFWVDQAESLDSQYRSTWVGPQPMTRRRVEALVRHQDTPGLPTPDVASFDAVEWQKGEWRNVLASYVHKEPLGVIGKYKATCLRIEAPTNPGTVYVAYLPMEHVPQRVRYDANWLHKASRFPFPVDACVYFEVLGSADAEKEVGKAVEVAENQQMEDAEAGIRQDETTAIQGQAARDVKTNIILGRRSMVKWRCVLAVYSTDKKVLRDQVEKVITEYKSDNIDLGVPHNDQRELFYESLPGTGVLVEDWFHSSNVEYFAAAMPWLTSAVGDGEDSPANYQGWTVNRDGSRDRPFFYDLQNVAEVAGTAPTEAVIANPGYGKTVSRGLKAAHENAMQGHTVFVWDPKGDFIKLHEFAKRLKLNPDRVKLLDMNSPRLSVSLDAFEVAEVDTVEGIDDRPSSARWVLGQLCSKHINNPSRGLEFDSLIVQLITATMESAAREGQRPSMQRLMRILETWTEGDFSEWPKLPEKDYSDRINQAALILTELRLVEGNKFGRFLFIDPNVAGVIKVNPGDMVIFAAKDMPYTEPGDAPNEKTIIGDIISGLMTDYIRALLYRLPNDAPKNVYLDEFHVIKKSPRNEALANWLRRMGRSKNTTVTQLSQSARDVDKSSLSTVWCGNPGNDEEAKYSCELLGIEPVQENIDVLLNLDKGEFIMRDVHKRVARVYVNIWDPMLFKTFNTQDSTVARQERAKARAERDVQGEKATV